MTSFTELMAAAERSETRLIAHPPAEWMQGRTIYGGLTAAYCHEAARLVAPDAPPLRSATIAFIGPAGGEVEARAEVLRAGRNVQFIGADLIGEKGIAARCQFAFGAGRESIFDEVHMPAPSVPAPADCPPLIPEGAIGGPSFATKFDTRLARGGFPLSGSGEHDHLLWIRHRDPDAVGMSAMLAIADMPPPAMLAKFPAPAPVSSITWMLNVLVEEFRTEDGWWLLQTRAEHARAGYSSQDMLIWNAAGAPAIAARQSVALFL